MGAIKDVVDLVTQLSKSVKDRELTADLMQVISLISAIQSDQIALTDKNFELMHDKAALETLVAVLQEDIAKLQKEISDLKNLPVNSPKSLTDESFAILKLLFEKHNGYSIEGCAKQISLPVNEASYHFDILKNHDFIKISRRAVLVTSATFMDEFSTYPRRPARSAQYSLTPLGRAFYVENRKT